MASWGANNDVNSAPTFLNGMVGAGYANVSVSYANTAPNANTTGPTLTLLSANSATGKYAQPGWVYDKRGTGNRAGRIQREVLVALNSNSAVSGV